MQVRVESTEFRFKFLTERSAHHGGPAAKQRREDTMSKLITAIVLIACILVNIGCEPSSADQAKLARYQALLDALPDDPFGNPATGPVTSTPDSGPTSNTAPTSGPAQVVQIQVTTLPTSEVTEISATLNGTIFWQGATNVRRWFQWGQTLALENNTPAVFTNPGIQSESLFGLPSNSGVYYRLVADSAETGLILGQILSFNTLPEPPPPPSIEEQIAQAIALADKAEADTRKNVEKAEELLQQFFLSDHDAAAVRNYGSRALLAEEAAMQAANNLIFLRAVHGSETDEMYQTARKLHLLFKEMRPFRIACAYSLELFGQDRISQIIAQGKVGHVSKTAVAAKKFAASRIGAIELTPTAAVMESLLVQAESSHGRFRYNLDNDPLRDNVQGLGLAAGAVGEVLVFLRLAADLEQNVEDEDGILHNRRMNLEYQVKYINADIREYEDKIDARQNARARSLMISLDDSFPEHVDSTEPPFPWKRKYEGYGLMLKPASDPTK